MTRGPLRDLYAALFDSEIGSRPTLIDARDAQILVKVARYLRVAKVKRKGRPGARGYVLTPRHQSEWRKRPGVLR